MKGIAGKLLCIALCGCITLTSCAHNAVSDGQETSADLNSENVGESVDMYITDLMVNNLIEPLGIDTMPTFRWINNMAGYARSQSAYRIIVSSSRAGAETYVGDVWDSGKTVGNCNYDITNLLVKLAIYFFA